MDVFEVKNWLGLPNIPHGDAPVQGARDEQVLLVQRAKVVDGRLLELVGREWL